MMDLFNIQGWRAIVTGGTRGLGYSMAEGLLEAGARVVIFGTTQNAENVAGEFRSRGYDCQGLVVDLADAKQREAGFFKGDELPGHHHQCCRYPAPLSLRRVSCQGLE